VSQPIRITGHVGGTAVDLRIEGLDPIEPRDLYASAVAGAELSEHVRTDTPKQRQSFAARVFRVANELLRGRGAR